MNAVMEALQARAVDLSRLGAKILVQLEDGEFLIDGTSQPAVIGSSDESADCILRLSASLALRYLNKEIAGCALISGQNMQVYDFLGGKSAMRIVFRLQAIWHGDSRLPAI